MKTQNLFSLGIITVVALILTSCGTSIDIAKRHFNDGYYIHVNKNKPVVKKNEMVLENKENDLNLTVSEKVSVAENQIKIESISLKTENVNDNAMAVASSDNKPLFSKKKAFAINAAEDNSVNRVKTDFGFRKHFSNAKKESELQRHHSSQGSDVPAIILILLCLFLPFIAVGIVDNWGTRFLISILLTILFWIPGVIYAFIVCFG